MCKTFFVSVLILAMTCVPARAQGTSDLFNPDVLHEIRIAIHPADWEQLKGHFDENRHYPADFHWIFQGHDEQASQVSVRSRGGGSRSGIKPGLTVDFDRFTGQTFLGLKTVVLRNNTQDASMLRERLAMRFMTLMGIRAPREAHARLYVNEEYAGLYSIVEAIDEPFLQRAFHQSNGYLYKYEWEFSWFFDYLGSDPVKYSPLPFKPETHETRPFPWPLEWMVRAINQIPEPYFETEASWYVDLIQFIRYIAIENFLAEQDGLLGDWGVNNFYLYRFADSSQSQFIPWDKSQSFNSLDWTISHHVETNVLARKALAVPELRALYVDTLRQSAQVAGGSGGWLEREIVNEYQQIHDAALEDSLKQCYSADTSLVNCSNERFEAEVAFLLRFAQLRSGDVLQQLN